MVKPRRKLKKILFILGITGAVYGGFKYLLPLVIPFLLAYGAALWMRPSVRFLERKLKFRFRKKEYHLPAALIGGAELFLAGGFLFFLFYFGSTRLLSQARLFAERLPQWLSGLDTALTGFCKSLEQKFGLRDGYLVELSKRLVFGLREAARQSTMPLLMNNSMLVLKGLVKTVIFLVIFFVAVLMVLQEMDEIRERKSRSFFHREFSLISRRLVSVGNAWLRTQFIIMAVTSLLCILGFFLIGNPYSILVGIGIGLLDALPVFGTGSVLIPWGILLFVRRQWGKGAVVLALYAVCYLVRQFLEARIMGNQVGLSALETLMSMYVGLELFGVAGFLLGPIGLLLIEDLLSMYWEQEQQQ